MWIHRDKCEDGCSKAARNKHPDLFFLRLICHIFLLLLILSTFFIVKAIQLGLACPLLLSPLGHGELQALLQSQQLLSYEDEVSHVGKSTIEILLFLIIAALCVHVMCMHTWFGHHRLLCSLFNSDSDWLSVQLFLTGRRAVFTDNVNLQCPLSLRTRGCLDVTKEAVLQGLQTWYK